jgi:hypothetical protein
MNLRTDVTLSADHLSVLCDGGVWVELPRKFEDIAYIKPECEKCEKTTFLKCIQNDGTTRLANCEMIEGAKLFTEMGNAPPPQNGRLYEMYLEKNKPKVGDAE